MQNNEKLPALGPVINIAKIPSHQSEDFFITKDEEWVKELLIELNSNATDRTPEMYLMKSFLDIKLNIKKKFKGSLGEFVLIRGHLNVEFMTSCVRTLKEMKDYIDVEFKACVIDSIHKDKPEYEEVIEIFEDNDVFDLYFYDNRTLDIRSIIHEQIYLNVNEYPILDKDTPLFPEVDPKISKILSRK